MQLEYIFNINNGEFPSLGILQKTHTVDEEGNILSSSNQRWLVYPTDENPTDSQEVQDKMNEVFAEEVKVKYQEYLESLKPSQGELLKQDLENQKQNILTQFDNIDLKSIRVMREKNQTKLDDLEKEAVLLRNQLKEINLKLDDLQKDLNDT